MKDKPTKLDLDRKLGLTIEWADGTNNFFPIEFLRRMSPSAEQRELRREMENNPLTVLPQSSSAHTGPLQATNAELVGGYAVRITFSDGHNTGLYTWGYLRELSMKLAAEARSTAIKGGNDD